MVDAPSSPSTDTQEVAAAVTPQVPVDAENEEFVKLLLAHRSIDVNATETGGGTARYLAELAGYTAIAKLLARKGGVSKKSSAGEGVRRAPYRRVLF